MNAKQHSLTVADIDKVLPQTQCEQCNFPGCEPYASALLNGEAEVNQCLPGGAETVAVLAKLLNKTVLPLAGKTMPSQRARIVEPDCIGCTKCIQACPVDAIIGTGKRMHTVITDLCTGCELCIAPCPTDCIELDPLTLIKPAKTLHANQSRLRYQAHKRRLSIKKTNKRTTANPNIAPTNSTANLSHKRDEIKAAVARVKAKRANFTTHSQHHSSTKGVNNERSN